MRWLASWILVCVAACGPSADEGASDSSSLSGGNAQPGSGGHAGTDAAAPGSGGSGGKGGVGQSGGAQSTGGSTGSGGAQSTGGSTGSGGAQSTGGSTGSGGAQNTGGSTGTGGTVVVTPCDNLPAAGQWQNITPTVFKTPSNMETIAVVVDPRDQTVYAAGGNATSGGSSGTGVYKSTDCGASFSRVSVGTNSDKLLTGDPWAMMIDPAHPDTLYINNGYGNGPTIYKSTNRGVDWMALSPHPVWKTNSFVQAIAMDPGDPSHVAVSFHNTCPAPDNGMCLSRSRDGGATWQIIEGPSALTGWQEAATVSVLGPASYLYAADGAWYTGDDGHTWTKVVNDGFMASYAGSSALVNGVLYLAGAGSLYQSASSPLGKIFTGVQGSSRSSTVISDGISLFTSYAWAYGGNPVYVAKLTDTTKWTNMAQASRGANQLAYDAAHHVIYATNWGAGFWRLVTR